LRRLIATLGLTLSGRVVSCAGDPPGWVPELLAELSAGQDVLLLTGPGPAGTTGADRSLITAAAADGIRVTVLPGPSAVTAALAVAGLRAERFTFEGVPPPRAELRERRFAELAAERRTLIFTESPRLLGRTLAELAAAFGVSRPAVICRALATLDADVQRGTLGELASQPGGYDPEGATPRSSCGDSGEATAGSHCSGQGDVTIVVAGAPVPDAGAAAPVGESLAEAVAQVRALVAAGSTTRDAVAAVAAQTGLRKRDIYNAASGVGPPAGPPLG
jgi:16S rRNA (cytidine1402-2'-O)-methyltransferase